MKLFRKDKHIEYPATTTKYVFSFVGTSGYLGKKSTWGKLEDAFIFDEEPSWNHYWELLRQHHPNSAMFHYVNPYCLAKVEVGYRVIEESPYGWTESV